MRRTTVSHDVAISALRSKRLAPAGSQLVLVEWTIPGGSSADPEWMAPLHIHHDEDERGTYSKVGCGSGLGRTTTTFRPAAR